MALSTLEMIQLMANSDFDLETYKNSQTCRTIFTYQECRNTYPDEYCQEVVDYWAKRGLKKELHNIDDPANKWASYLPLEFVNAETKNKTYPLLFVLHGSNNPIYLAETYGYTHIAAREKLIVIIPENESAKSIDALFAYAKAHYPVDWSRVYMVGYSLGGIMTSRHAFRWPERFAAVGVGGMLFANGTMLPYPHLGITWPAETFTEDMVAHAADVKVPVCSCMGEHEFNHVLPIHQGEPMYAPSANGESPVIALDISAKNKIASVNNWRRMAGCEPIPEETVQQLVENSADIVTEKLGFPFEKTYVKTYEGRSQFIGDCVNSNGEVLARFVCIAKSAHWPCAGLAQTTWDFIKNFSRDPQSNRLIRASHRSK